MIVYARVVFLCHLPFRKRSGNVQVPPFPSRICFRRGECVKRGECVEREEEGDVQVQREEREADGGEKRGIGKEHSSCMYRMRVEFYACLIWKWIARECASMRRVEEASREGRRQTRKRDVRERKREKEREVKWTISSFLLRSPACLLPSAAFFLRFVPAPLLPSCATRTGQRTARKPRELLLTIGLHYANYTHICTEW